MARPVGADADATRQRILTAAAGRFSDRGLEGASIRDIAKGAGVSLAMVHHYFGNKRGLYDACVDAMYDELFALREVLEARLTDAQSLGEIVEEAVRGGFRFAREHQVAVRLLLRTVVEVGELDEARRANMQSPFLDQVSSLISQRTRQPERAVRLAVQSITFLTARYAVSSDNELQLLTLASQRDAVRVAEDHLVESALRLLDVSPTLH